MLLLAWRFAATCLLGVLLCVGTSSVKCQEEPLVPLCFCAVRSTNYTHTDSDRVLPFDNVTINDGDGFDQLTHSFTVPANRSGGYFWLTWSIGIPAGEHADVRLTGTPRSPNLLRNHSVFTSGPDTTSRSELVYLQSDNETIGLVSSFSLYSDPSWQTSFCGFSLSDTMSEVVAFSFGRSVPTASSTIPYDITHVDTHSGYNHALNSYFIQRSGLYVVTYSMAVVSDAEDDHNYHTNVLLYSAPPQTPISALYMVDLGVDAASQTFIVDIQRTGALFTWLGNGVSYSDTRGYQTSMMGFMYSPKASLPLAWLVYTQYEYEGPVDRIPFEDVLVDTESGWNNATSSYTVQAAGTYYIHLSVHMAPRAPTRLELAVNGVSSISVYRESIEHRYQDQRTRATILRLNAGDQLTVRLPDGYSIDGFETTLPKTQFIGFCIYN